MGFGCHGAGGWLSKGGCGFVGWRMLVWIRRMEGWWKWIDGRGGARERGKYMR